MIRRLLLLLVAAFLGWRWLRRNRTTKPPSPGGATAPAAGGAEMVRDRVCNTFVPRSRALVLDNGADTLFFCSAACRDKHRKAQR